MEFLISRYIGEPEDSRIEAACREFRSACARIEQEDCQYKLDTKGRYRRDWELVKRILHAVEEANGT